jgi:cysteine desulfurase
MEIYLDANATTPVLARAQAAALDAMSDAFGNPSSIHGSGLKARVLLDTVRAVARRVLQASTGELLFTSGATEAIQTAVLSALSALRDLRNRETGDTAPQLLLYGATEHKAVPEAIKHWNSLLGLHFEVLSIPVGNDGRHDLQWLRRHASRAGVVCTMAANNETGVISDLEGIASALSGSQALWIVDSVQALGKLSLRLADLPIDYAPFSGHKLYAPKGIGFLYVRQGAPITPLIAGGGQEGALRSGTENMPGIAALGVVLAALEEGHLFRSHEVLEDYRARLAGALRDAFPRMVFNAPAKFSLPTTLNFSVPTLSSKQLLDLFDAAQMRVSGGSACSESKAQPSFVLEAMGLPKWQTESAVRLSFGPMTEAEFIDEACRRIRSCGESLRESCLTTPSPNDRLTRFTVGGACCYLVVEATSLRCVVIDPLPELTERLAYWIRCRNLVLAAVLDTHSHGDHASSAVDLRAAVPTLESCEVDALGWPVGTESITLGSLRMTRLPIPGHTKDSTAYVLSDAQRPCAAFVGDTVMPGAMGRSDFEQSDPLAFAPSLRKLENLVGANTLLLPGHDYENRFACTLAIERTQQPLLAAALDGTVTPREFAGAKAELEQNLLPTKYQTMACGAQADTGSMSETAELAPREAIAMFQSHPHGRIVDVREPYEQRLGKAPHLGHAAWRQTVPLSRLLNALPEWLSLPSDTPVLFFCRSGRRSAQAALALRRLGHKQAWSVAGGLALWPTDAATAWTAPY